MKLTHSDKKYALVKALVIINVLLLSYHPLSQIPAAKEIRRMFIT